jgi:hypothetical protein
VQWRLKLAAVQKISQCLAKNAEPFFPRDQPLRIFPQLGQEASNTDVRLAFLVAHAARAGDDPGHLRVVLGLRAVADSGRGNCDRFEMILAIGQAGE